MSTEASTEWESLIRQMGRLKADLAHLQQEVTDTDVPAEVQASANLIASDYDTLVRKMVEYVEGGGMPDECPVCGDAVVTMEDMTAGESYAVDKLCVEEQSATGVGHSIIHFDCD